MATDLRCVSMQDADIMEQRCLLDKFDIDFGLTFEAASHFESQVFHLMAVCKKRSFGDILLNINFVN